MMRIVMLAMLPLFLAGCDVIKDRMGIKDPAKVEAEAKAVGASCRLSGRSLEDCYALNERAPRAPIYDGWKEMNEYMAERQMTAMPPSVGKVARPPAVNQSVAENGAGKDAVVTSKGSENKDIRPKLPDLATEAKGKH